MGSERCLVNGLLHVVDEVLHEVSQRRRVRIVSIYGLYAREVAVVAHGPLHAQPVLLCRIHVASPQLVAGVQQRVGIDAAHGLTPRRGGETRGGGLPVGYVGAVVAEQHIGTHGEEGVLLA